MCISMCFDEVGARFVKICTKVGTFFQRPQDFVLFAGNFILDVKMVVLHIWMVIWVKAADFDVEKVYF